MVTTIRHKIIGAITLSMLVIASLGWVSYSFLNNVITVSQQSSQSQHILILVEKARTILSDVRREWDAPRNAKDPINSDLIKEEILLNQHILELDSLLKNSPSNEWAKSFKVATTDAFRLFDSQNGAPTTADTFDPALTLLLQLEQQQTLARKERQSVLTEAYYRFVNVSIALLVTWLAIMAAMVHILIKNLQARDAAEKKLKVALDENLDLYENAPCGYFTVNHHGMIVNANKTLLFWLGYNRREQVVDRLHLENLLFKEEVFFIEDLLKRGDKTNGSLELDMVRKDASPLPVAIQFALHPTPTGAHLRCSVVDNTVRKKIEHDIQQANKELEAFSYSVSHDLRAPLRSINGYAQILREDYEGAIDDEGKRVIGIIVNNGKKMGQLIDDLLAFSRTGRQDIIHTSIPMDEWARSLAHDLIEHETGRTINLTVHPLQPATGDASLIQQVWINLLSNAIKYTRNRDVADIEVGSTANAEEIVYYVKDNGAGFNMNYYSKLFGVFQRLHKDEEFEGTGVGLALVKRILERHNGKIWAESKPGEGATFYFSMPTSHTTTQPLRVSVKNKE